MHATYSGYTRTIPQCRIYMRGQERISSYLNYNSAVLDCSGLSVALYITEKGQQLLLLDRFLSGFKKCL